MASTKAGRFRVRDSHCWQQPARFRKNCYQSCNTDLVEESRRFELYINFGQWLQIVFDEKWNFDGFCKNLWQTKAAFVSLLNLLIIHWFLSKINHRNKSAGSKLNPVQHSGSKILNQWPVQETFEFEQTPFWTKQHSHFSWLHKKACTQSFSQIKWKAILKAYGLVVKAISSQSGDMSSIPAGCWKS